MPTGRSEDRTRRHRARVAVVAATALAAVMSGGMLPAVGQEQTAKPSANCSETLTESQSAGGSQDLGYAGGGGREALGA